MKKVIIALAVLCLFSLSSCNEGGSTNNTSTNSTKLETTTESTTISMPTSEELLIYWGTQEGWELGQKHIRFLSESTELSKNFDWSENKFRYFAILFVDEGIQEIKELTVEEALPSGYKPIIIQDATGKVYYIAVNEYGTHGEVCTEEEWLMAMKHKQVLSENIDLSEFAIENVSEILAVCGVKEINELDILEGPEVQGDYLVRIEDVLGDVYHINFSNTSIGRLMKGDFLEGEVLYPQYVEEVEIPTDRP